MIRKLKEELPDNPITLLVDGFYLQSLPAKSKLTKRQYDSLNWKVFPFGRNRILLAYSPVAKEEA
jgi:hypothetical protein